MHSQEVCIRSESQERSRPPGPGFPVSIIVTDDLAIGDVLVGDVLTIWHACSCLIYHVAGLFGEHGDTALAGA